MGQHVTLESLVNRLQKAQATNSTASSFSALIPTLTRPVASATRTVFDPSPDPMPPKGTRDRNSLVVYPYGGNDNNDIILTKVSGWSKTVLGLYFSSLICEVAGTLSSTLPGLASMEVSASEYFCDTLTLTTGIAVLYNGTSDKDTAFFIAPVGGFEIVEITYSTSTGGNTQNALYRFDA